jgi:hypothetical protein
MIKLTDFARIARQHNVSFYVMFTDTRSYVQVGGNIREWHNEPFMIATRNAGVHWYDVGHEMRMFLESLT